jgi:putative peptidoglycan lipid II flippase
MTSSKALSNTQIVRAALIVLIGFLASGVLGFIRTLIISQTFGAGEALDSFIAAQRIPEIIFVLVAGGALGSSFIPIYARRRKDDEAEAWRLASAVTTLAALAALILGIGVTLAAPWLVSNFLRPQSTPEVQALTVNMMRLMMVTPVIFSISGLIMGVLQSHQQFLLPSVAISMNNIGIIIGALVIAPLLTPDPGAAQVGNANAYGLAYGAILSAILHLVVQIPGLRKIDARLRPLLDWHIPGVIEVLALMGPRVLGLAVVQINFIVNIVLTDPMIPGSLTALSTAFTLMFFAIGIIGQSIGSAVFPTLSALSAENDFEGFKNRLSSVLRSVLFLSFPATAVLILLGNALVSLFERGEWTDVSTRATAWALAFYAIGIAGFSLLEVLSRAFYALSDTWTPVKIGIVSMVSNIVLSLIFVQVIGVQGSLVRGPFAGLALANSLTTILESLVLWWLLRRRLGSVNDAYVLGGTWRTIVASLAMALVLLLIGASLANTNAFVILVVCGIVGGAVFFGVSAALGLDEARAVPMMLLRRFKR